jgi:phosphoenolpyruvate carboxylase
MLTRMTMDEQGSEGRVDARLRADIRDMVRILGDVIRDEWGEEFFNLVEDVRNTTRALRETPDPQRLQDLIDGLDLASLDQIQRLVRAFTIYFHLANTVEQHHRIGPELVAGGHDAHGVLHRAAAAGISGDELRAFYERMQVRPVFTAHPTEAARRSILGKLQALDEALRDWQDDQGGPGKRDRAHRRMAEVIEGIVQTDELRLERPQPADEAGNVLYYLEQLFGGTVAEAVDAYYEALAAAGGITERPQTSPIRFGTWVGGDRALARGSREGVRAGLALAERRGRGPARTRRAAAGVAHARASDRGGGRRGARLLPQRAARVPHPDAAADAQQGQLRLQPQPARRVARGRRRAARRRGVPRVSRAQPARR